MWEASHIKRAFLRPHRLHGVYDQARVQDYV